MDEIQQDEPTCHLLSLPRELRNRIYELLFPQHSDPDAEVDLLTARPPEAALVKTCHKTHDEANLMYRASYRDFWNSNFVVDLVREENGKNVNHARCASQIVASMDADFFPRISRVSVQGRKATWSIDLIESERVTKMPFHKGVWTAEYSQAVTTPRSDHASEITQIAGGATIEETRGHSLPESIHYFVQPRDLRKAKKSLGLGNELCKEALLSVMFLRVPYVGLVEPRYVPTTSLQDGHMLTSVIATGLLEEHGRSLENASPSSSYVGS